MKTFYQCLVEYRTYEGYDLLDLHREELPIRKTREEAEQDAKNAPEDHDEDGLQIVVYTKIKELEVPVD